MTTTTMYRTAFVYMYVYNGVVVITGLPNTFHNSVQNARQSVGIYSQIQCFSMILSICM